MCCTVADCGRTVVARGFCDPHYRRFRKWGDPLASAPKKPERTCEVDGCDRKHYAKGVCGLHRKRLELFGTVHWQPPTPTEKFWANVQKGDKPTSCWIWTGYTIGDYGYLRIWRNEPFCTGAHRFSYELHVGPIPAGLVIDHICRVPLCVNPDHLRPVTIGENVLLGVSPMAINKRRTFCRHDHEYTEANTYRDKKGHRSCRTCGRQRALAAYHRKKEAA